jgi:hypothetical protein
MPTEGFAVVSRFSSKFVHEVLPVALASVIGTLIVNHYGARPAATPVVVQTEPPADAAEMVKTLQDERAIIAEYLKRDAAAAPAQADPAPAANPSVVALIADNPPEPPARPAAAKKAAQRLAPKPATDKKSGVAAPTHTPAAVELADWADAPGPAVDFAPAAPDRSALDALRSWAIDAAQLSARALAAPFFAGRPIGAPGGGPRFN